MEKFIIVIRLVATTRRHIHSLLTERSTKLSVNTKAHVYCACPQDATHTHTHPSLLPTQVYILAKEGWEQGMHIALRASAYGNQTPALSIPSFRLLIYFMKNKIKPKHKKTKQGPVPTTSNFTANVGTQELRVVLRTRFHSTPQKIYLCWYMQCVEKFMYQRLFSK